jgi:hypothetical protein
MIQAIPKYTKQSLTSLVFFENTHTNHRTTLTVLCLFKMFAMHLGSLALLLLDALFCEAYINGTVIWFSDGIEHLVFPRIFTYSADYPEK